MSASDKKARPGRSFAVLGIFSALLAGLVALGVVFSSATWAPKLALDLEGGTSIILEPQIEDQQITKEQLEQAVEIIRQRVDSTGVSEAEISTQGDRNIVVNLPGNPDEKTRNLVRSSAQLSFRRVAFVGPPESAAAQEEQQKEQEDANKKKSEGLSDEDKKRIEDLIGDQEGEQEDGDAPQGGGTASAPADGEDAKKPAEGETPAAPKDGKEDADKHPRFDPMTDTSWQSQKVMKEFTELDCTDPANRTGGKQTPADEVVVECAQDGSAKFVLGPVELSGEHVKDASYGFETSSSGQQTNRLAVTMEFDEVGRKVFGEITQTITGQQQPYNQFAIELDGLVLSAPASQSAVTDGRAQITGSFSEEEAQTLSNQLKNGALPISFQVQSEEQISPTLGADYLQKGLIAGAIGLLLVVLYSVLQYRALSTVTIASLVAAGILTYLLLLFASWRYGYRLSLAGLAGIIIGIGMTADSFIVYFERIRDEIRDGRRLTSAVEVGWVRARQTIYASKAVNMLAAVILYILAVGSVRGFAFTLGLTVIVDVVIVVFFTHPMLQLLARTKFFGEGHPMSGMDPRQLGVKPAAYRGAMGLDLEKAKQKTTGRSAEEAERRESARKRRERDTSSSLAARKAAAAAEEAGED
ncbi:MULTISPECIES: protein translocase subunit SecD [Brevibacterium]|uniref:protein translocase subunit SecD n=1 Tax=Brevibacterium TaxID=1696 RepID=UPI0008A28717|nr:protein translocase subunit SecD [Brevibacterium sp. HMSC22B09]MCG7299714.1 protein translocase subunit SecD [Brevibacterium ravenspurgense]OFT98103.1 preprotein translocase subunit SecD [Brevibacterium sp. HMSC22B09]